MNPRILILVLVVAALAGGAGYWLHGAPHAQPAAAPAQERKVLYWYDPMEPGQHFDQPGKSPFMDMDLLPRYADEISAAGGVAIAPRLLQNMGVRTAAVVSGAYSRQVETVGLVRADEHRIAAVQSRANGWVERLQVKAAGETVARGQLLAEIYAPDLLAAQEEYLLGLKRNDESIQQAARERLSLLGLNPAQLNELEKSKQATRRVAVYAPIGGVVTELGVREGAAVNPGMTLFSLVDLGSVWITAEIAENQAAWIKLGNAVEARVAALPGRVFKGRVDYLYPEVNAASRTLKARMVFDNPGIELKPGMYANVMLAAGAKQDALLVPSEAVIITGKRSVVIVAEGGGHFRPVEVVVGGEAEGKTEILDGLSAGQQVVVSGQFLIDSEASLKGGLQRLDGDSSKQSGEGSHDRQAH